MQFIQEEINQIKQLAKAEANIELSDAEAMALANQLLTIVRFCLPSKPEPKDHDPP